MSGAAVSGVPAVRVRTIPGATGVLQIDAEGSLSIHVSPVERRDGPHCWSVELDGEEIEFGVAADYNSALHRARTAADLAQRGPVAAVTRSLHADPRPPIAGPMPDEVFIAVKNAFTVGAKDVFCRHAKQIVDALDYYRRDAAARQELAQLAATQGLEPGDELSQLDWFRVMLRHNLLAPSVIHDLIQGGIFDQADLPLGGQG